MRNKISPVPYIIGFFIFLNFVIIMTAKSSVGKLDTGPICTAFFYKPYHIITNAHCVKKSKGVYSTSEGELFAVCRLKEIHKGFDWATLRCKDTETPLNIAQDEFTEGNVHILFQRNGQIIRSDCRARRVNKNRLHHNCTTYRGSSGAPILNENGEVVGYHRSWKIYNTEKVYGIAMRIGLVNYE